MNIQFLLYQNTLAAGAQLQDQSYKPTKKFSKAECMQTWNLKYKFTIF